MLTNEEIMNLRDKGFKRWQKGDMDRIYIDYTTVNEWCFQNEDLVDGESLKMYMDKREINSGKMWVDAVTGEIETKGIECEAEVKAIIRKYIEA